jgi:hypothetical protein
VLKLSHNQKLMDDHGHLCGLKLGLHLPWNTYGTRKTQKPRLFVWNQSYLKLSNLSKTKN